MKPNYIERKLSKNKVWFVEIYPVHYKLKCQTNIFHTLKKRLWFPDFPTFRSDQVPDLVE